MGECSEILPSLNTNKKFSHQIEKNQLCDYIMINASLVFIKNGTSQRKYFTGIQVASAKMSNPKYETF